MMQPGDGLAVYVHPYCDMPLAWNNASTGDVDSPRWDALAAQVAAVIFLSLRLRVLDVMPVHVF